MGIFSKAKKKEEEKQEVAVEADVVSDAVAAKPQSDPAAQVQLLAGSLVQPRVSEKAGKLAKLNKYVFLVERGANKISVKKAVEKSYKVKVTQVNMVNMRGRDRLFGRIKGKTAGFRKAIVTLKQGNRIEGVAETV